MTNHYQLGLRTTPARTHGNAYRRGIVVGGTGVLGTGIAANLTEEMGQLRAEMDAVEHEMFGQTSGLNLGDPRETFYRGVWEPFYLSWVSFQNSHERLTGRILDYLVSPLVAHAAFRDIQDFRARLVAMHDAAKAIGFAFTGPDPTPPKQGDLPVFASHVAGLLKVVVIVAIIAVGGFFLLKVLELKAKTP